MSYKRITELPFPWSFKELMDLPIFMINHIYEMLDEFIEQDKQKFATMTSKR
ncbi:MAG: hypothetical protein ACTSU7_09780 [Candidatus Heimdallarchaeaceae archaeon]